MNKTLECLNIAHRIQKRKPWLHFSDADFIQLSPYEKEPIFVTIMGNAKTTYGIGFYFGNRAFEDLLYVLDNPDLPELQRFRYTDALTIYFDKKDEMEAEDLALLDQAEIKITKAQRGPLLRKLHYNIPSSFNDVDLDRLAYALGILEKALDRYEAKQPEVYFAYGELLRFKESTKGTWVLRGIQMQNFYHVYPFYEFDVKKLRKSNPAHYPQQIELDFAVLNTLIDDDEKDPYLPRAMMIASVSDQFMHVCQIMDSNQKIEELYAQTLLDFIKKNGRPDAVIVRDPQALAAIEGIAFVLEIPFAMSNELYIIDDFIQAMQDTQKGVEEEYSKIRFS